MRDSIALWNYATQQRRPTLAALTEGTGRAAIPVFPPLNRVVWAAPSFLIEIADERPDLGSSPALAVVLGFTEHFFRVPVDHAIVMENTRAIWKGLSLPCDGETLRAHVRDLTSRALTFSTESGIAEEAVEWTVRAGALEFRFAATSSDPVPEHSALLYAKFYFTIDAFPDVGASLAPAD